ncbi:MAG: nicotinate-nucleotide adenylyltransferase [Eubacteriales bacterium]
MGKQNPYTGKNKKIGILGGTFNPVHFGHMHMAESAMKYLNLDRVVFMPAGIPPHKKLDYDTSPEDRLNMLSLAIAGNDNFFIDDYEAYFDEKAYSYLSLQRIQKLKDKSSELYFIIGADSLMQLNKWKNPDKLLKLAKFAVIPRGDCSKKECLEKIESLQNEYGGEIKYIDCEKVEMSSTKAREYDFNNQSKNINPEVAKYIIENGLYKKMTDTSRIEKYLKEHLSKRRLKHVYGTVKEAEKLAELYGEDAEKAKLAALLHDSAKHMSCDEVLFLAKEYGFEMDEMYLAQPELLHGAAGAYIAKNMFNITDTDILDAITYHTVPRINMTKLDKIISVADLIEETRDYPQVDELRSIADKGLDAVFLKVLERVILHVVHKNDLLHINSVIVYNNLLKEMNKDDKLLKQSQGDN